MTKKLANQIKLRYMAAGIVMVAVNLVGDTLDVSASSDADYSFIIDADWHTCQQINAEYQEIYAFETASYHINICQKDDMYFYSGEAKQDEASTVLQNSTFMPAKPLENYRGFQAEYGNVTYLVMLPHFSQAQPSTLNPGEAILTIKRNGQLVSVESSLNKYCDRSEEIALSTGDQVSLHVQDINQLATNSQSSPSNGQLFLSTSHKLSSMETFDANSRFDFYYLDGKLHRLTTCDS